MRKVEMLLCVLAALLALTVTISCSEYPITITPVLIAEGDIFAGDNGNFVVKTLAELNNLMCYRRSEFLGDIEVAACSQYWAEKNIDFDMYQIIAVVDWVRPQFHWNINIINIKEYSDNIVVSIRINAPRGPAPDALSQPYQIVKIPVTVKDVVFEYTNK